MALAASSLTFGGGTGGAAVTVTASITPTANALVLVGLLNIDADFSLPEAPTSVVGNSLTYVSIQTFTYVDFGGGDLLRLSLYRALGASPTAGAVTITWPVNQQAMIYSIFQITGVDTSGTNGSGAIVQSAIGDLAAPGPSLTVNLAAFGSPNNMAAGLFGYGADTGEFTPGSGFTTMAEVDDGFGSDLILTEVKLNDTSVDASYAPDRMMGAIAVEVKEAVAGFQNYGRPYGVRGERQMQQLLSMSRRQAWASEPFSQRASSIWAPARCSLPSARPQPTLWQPRSASRAWRSRRTALQPSR